MLGLAQIQIGDDIDGEGWFDQSGQSTSISSDGQVVAIGAHKNGGNGYESGHVRIYHNDAGTWTQVGVDINGEATSDESGWSVSLSADGNVVAIGAPKNDDNGINAGQVRIYQNNAGNWTQLGEDIDGVAAVDISGASVSLSEDGSVVAIGAPGNDVNGAQSGHVRVYQNIGGTWTQVGEDIDGDADYDRFGTNTSLSADGNVVAIGAPYNGDNGDNSGHVKVFNYNASAWTQVGDDIGGEDAEDISGWSVSLSSDGTVIAIGANRNDGNGSNAGHVRVYQNIAGTWTQVGADIDGEAPEDYSGCSVALSADGNVIAIGAYRNDGNGNNAGHVRIYQNIGGTWTQVGTDIDGEAEGDFCGVSVSLSGDGNVVAIGASKNDGNGTESGHVRMFDLSTILSSDHYVQTNFKVYPNPTSDFVNVQLSEGLKLERVNVYSASGQLVKTERNTSFSVNELAKGSYIIEVVTDLGKAAKTIIVE